MLHNLVGTPNTKYKGALADLENAASMFFTVRMANWRAHVQAAKSNPREYAKRMAILAVPSLLIAWGARNGLFGEGIAYLWSLIPEDEEDNHFIFPMFWYQDSDGRNKAMYLSVPRDQTDAFANTLLRRLFKAGIETGQIDKSEILADLRRETIGTWSPPVEIMGRWWEYGEGRMPVDSYFNRPIMSKSEYEAAQHGQQGPALRKLSSWTLSKFGAAGELLKPATGKLLGAPYEEGVDSDLEAALRSVPYLSRILRISDRGVENDLFERANEADAASSEVSNLVDPASRKVSARYNAILRIPKERRTPEDHQEAAMVSGWYNGIYRPWRKRIRLELDLDQPEEARKHAAHLKQITALFQRLWAAQRQGDEAAIEQAREQIDAWRPD